MIVIVIPIAAPRAKASMTALHVGGGATSKIDFEMASPSLSHSATKYLLIVLVQTHWHTTNPLLRILLRSKNHSHASYNHHASSHQIQ